jgi:HEAT repeat protein
MCARAPVFAVLAAIVLATTFPIGAAGQTLSARILEAEDARQLSAPAQAVLTEGLKDASPRIRVQAVRAMGRFESPALVGQIVPLLSDPDAGVRHGAAIAAANAAKVFPVQAIDALTAAMVTAPPADWAVFAASLGRITLPSAAAFAAAEHAIAAGLPVAPLRAQAAGLARTTVRPMDPFRVEGAARGLEALVRVNGKLGTLTTDTRARLFAVVEAQQGATARGLARARRLALLALRTDKAIDGDLALLAAKDPDDEVRRLAMTAAALATGDSAAIPDTDREAVLRAGLKDAEPRVRIDALRGWGRHQQGRDCAPIVAAVADLSPHV